jgi:maleate cis-trans isomerase
MGLRKIAVVNKWSDAMNRTLGEFLGRAGVSIVGHSTRSIAPAEFMKIKDEESMRLAYDLGSRAFRDNPDCDGVYVGGGAWLAEPVAKRLEDEFGKPVISNQPAMIRNSLRMLNAWTPRQGFSRIMATP